MPNHPSLYRQTLQTRTDLYNAAIYDGTYRPFVYPWDSLPVLFLVLGVALSPQCSTVLNRLSRWLLVISAFWYCLTQFSRVRTLGLTAGYGIGLSASWGLIITVVLLILHDPGKDFKRLEFRWIGSRGVDSGHKSQDVKIDRHGKQKSNGPGIGRRVTCNLEAKVSGRHASGLSTYVLVWQGYPRNFWHLMDWSFDLITSFRGINWNFRNRIPTQQIAPPEGDPPELPNSVVKRSVSDFRALQKQTVINFIFWYLVTDIVKTIAVTDPFLLGIASLDSPSPWIWLDMLNDVLPGATRFFRLCFSLGSVVTAVSLVFHLSPVFFPIVLPYLVGHNIMVITKAPLLEAWMYPPFWGPMFQSLCDKGLGGMWGTWWHQLFRYGISEPSRLLVKSLTINPRGRLSRAIQLLVAFSLTGIIHAAASSTTFSIVPSRPLDPFLFFFSQGLGIILQTTLSELLNSVVRLPKAIRRAGNFMFVFGFLLYTGPLLVADFARCGIWLFEPLPITFFRGFGFGPADCWFPWLTMPEGGQTLSWWRGDKWYRTGIAIH